MKYEDFTKESLISLLKEYKKVYSSVKHPADIHQRLMKYAGAKTESMFVITLSSASSIIKIHKISTGTTNKTLVHPREIFVKAIKDHATGIILAHNHPSGILDPSEEDKEVTKRINKVSEIIGIKLYDHVIFSKLGFYSFAGETNIL